ncbi:MAG: cyclase family protein [Armatimonadetes bacterium]|nr:cyclase family protein [Armatimonadota bacterium]
MRELIDLTHSAKHKCAPNHQVRTLVRASVPIDQVPLDALVALATVINLTYRPNYDTVTRQDLAKFGVSGIAGCILRTDWSDNYTSGDAALAPVMSVDAAAYLLEGGVRTIASDFPITDAAADLLLTNNCVLIHCLGNLATLRKSIVRLIALPLKLEDTLTAEARVIAMEE